MKTILGNQIRSSDITIINTIPRFTYRRRFEKLKEERHIISISSDTNWGCCIRCGQSLLFQYLQRCLMLNELALRSRISFDNILSLFNDNYEAPFSLHNICREVTRGGGHEGKWVSVSQLAAALESLLSVRDLPCYVCRNSTLEKSAVRSLISRGVPVLCLIPLMCGQRKFEMKYLEFVLLSLGLPNGVGFVGGVRNRSYYYVGFSAKKLFYFDPHTTKRGVSSEEQFRSYFEPQLMEMEFETLSPSLMTGFVFASEEELQRTLQIFQQFPYCPLFIVESLQEMDLDFPEINEEAANIVDGFDVISENEVF